MTYHHNTRILCDTCNTVSSHRTVTAGWTRTEETMTEYTPTTDEIRFRYTEYPYVAEKSDETADPAEFKRWLTEHDAEIRTATLGEAAEIARSIAQRLFDQGRHDVGFGAEQVRGAIRAAKEASK